MAFLTGEQLIFGNLADGDLFGRMCMPECQFLKGVIGLIRSGGLTQLFFLGLGLGIKIRCELLVVGFRVLVSIRRHLINHYNRIL